MQLNDYVRVRIERFVVSIAAFYNNQVLGYEKLRCFDIVFQRPYR